MFGTGASAANSDIRVFYNANTGGLYYDDDGNGADQAVQIAQLSQNLVLSHSDFILWA